MTYDCGEWKLKKNSLKIYYYRENSADNSLAIRILPVFKLNLLSGPESIIAWRIECGDIKKDFDNILSCIMWSDIYLSKEKNMLLEKIFCPGCTIKGKDILKLCQKNYRNIYKTSKEFLF